MDAQAFVDGFAGVVVVLVGHAVGLHGLHDLLVGVVVGLLVGGLGKERILLRLVLVAEVVDAQDHVLGRQRQRTPVGGGEDVVRGEHDQLRLKLGLVGERDVDGHLVAVEVGVECRADKRMQADCLAVDEDGVKGLDRDSVEGRGAVEENRVAGHNLVKHIPDILAALLNPLLRVADGVDLAHVAETADDEGLEEAEGHLLRKPALVDVEFGTDDDDRAPGIVHALSEEVLAEAPLLSLEHVGEGLEGAVSGACDGAAVAAVVHKRVNGLLEHPLFVADDDRGRRDLEEVLESAVAVDDPAVEVVQVAGGEAASFEWDEGAQIRWDDGQHVENHPARIHLVLEESLDKANALDNLLAVHLALGGGEQCGLLVTELGQVKLAKELLDGLGAHVGAEGLAIVLAVLVVLLGSQNLLEGKRSVAWIQDDVLLVVEDFVKGSLGHVEEQAKTGGGTLVEPDVGDWRGKFDVAHALTADTRLGDFDSAVFAGDASILEALVLAAGALVVLDRAKDAFAEETALFGLEGAVVDGLGALDFSLTPLADDFRGSNADGDAIGILHHIDVGRGTGFANQSIHCFTSVIRERGF